MMFGNLKVVTVLGLAMACSASGELLRHGRRLSDANCIGEVLRPGQALHPNEYIGPDWACPVGGYRFGLDENGYLSSYDYDGLTWHSGVRGAYLGMQQSDGNLVLYDENDDPVWSTHCFGDGVELRNDGGMPLVEAIDEDGNLVWQINSDGQETICYPENDDRYPQVSCRGNILAPGVRLYANEYICDRVGQHVRFGVNAQGRLNLWHGNRAVWSPPHLEDRGTFLEMQSDDGNIVFYNEYSGQPEAGWATDCFSEGTVLKIENGGVKAEKRNGDVLWMIDSLGNESGCNPSDTTPNEDCSSISFHGKLCEVQMIDFFNVNIVNVRVEDLGDGHFKVTDNFDEESCRGGQGDGSRWEVDVHVRSSGDLDIDAGVPDVTCDGILTKEHYQMRDDRQLTFRPNADHMCNTFGRNLIYFMVMEWFYFG